MFLRIISHLIKYKSYQQITIPNNYKINQLIKYKNIRLITTQPIFNKQTIDKTNTETEKEYFVKLKNDPDIFGEGPINDELIDEGDIREEEHFINQPLSNQKLSTKQYADKIKDFIRKHKIKEAIDYVEIKMLQEDRVKPENYIFNLLLGACGRVGYTKKAFSIYNQMKKRGLTITGGTYTALFNACSNSPWPEDGLTRAKHLRNIMIEKLYEPNEMNYNSMIKAFGRCGDLITAFNLVDEMITKKFNLKDDTLNFLLQACISDKEAGYRHALLVWRKFIDKNIKPSIFSYNLMLRVVRDCNMGDIEITKNVINSILTKEKLKNDNNNNNNNNNKQLLLSDLENSEFQDNNNLVSIENNQETNITIRDYFPNLMATIPHLGDVTCLSEMTRAEDRLFLIGGLKGYLNNMKDNEINPDVRTFTLLLDCIPNNLQSENELITIIKKSKLKIDIDFFNMLIKKRAMRFDYENSKDVLRLMRKYGCRPNIVTYGVLALSCKTKNEALEILNEMESLSLRVNIEILGAMVRQACYHMNFSYVLEIMEIVIREKIPVSKKFVEIITTFRNNCRKISNNQNNSLCSSEKFQRGNKLFKMRYKTWLEQIQMDETENVHPWQQYREVNNTESKHYREKSIRFKAKHTSLFKVKSSKKKNKIIL